MITHISGRCKGVVWSGGVRKQVGMVDGINEITGAGLAGRARLNRHSHDLEGTKAAEIWTLGHTCAPSGYEDRPTQGQC